MGLDFVKNYGGIRLEGGSPLPDQFNAPSNDEEEGRQIQLDIERGLAHWSAIDITNVSGWRAGEWQYSPIRFIDGKDIGQIIAWIRSPEGYPVPIRLAQVGGVAMRIIDGNIRREFFQTEKVVAMPADLFPADEVESFALALQENGFRLLPAAQPKNGYQEILMNYEGLRGLADQRTRFEMLNLEEAAIAQDAGTPSIVDGALDMHAGGFDKDTCPVFGVIKRHYRNYLHTTGQLLLYDLLAGERTPAFVIARTARPALLSWYLKINNDAGITPDSGYVRVEVAYDWFMNQHMDWDFADRLSKVLFEYRCRQKSYSRAAVSLHPIVRAEESLGSVFHPESSLYQRFYRVTDI
ncbi:MAG: hypothetical protein M1281_04625 [Chloroflexi bacterium]|nr:hypothetical protein [Chloroflexota bacterium]